MQFLEEAKRWLSEITEIILLLIALGIAINILLGPNVMFFGGIVANLTGLIETVGESGLAGLIGLGIIIVLFQRKRAPAYGQGQ
ncbi:hypothetical protein ES703_32905 [subsurface metagenome]